MNVLFVCTGNLCRSPMAEALLRRAIEERGCHDINVSSVGTWAYHGREATPEAIETVATRGADLSRHQSRPVETDELRAADVIVVMTSVHVREIAALASDVVDRIVLMKELREIEPGFLPPDASMEEKLTALLRGRRPGRRRKLDLDDPMGFPLHAYERCANEIQGGIDVLVKTLCD